MLTYLLTAIGLPPGGSRTVHIYTQTIHRTTQKFWKSAGCVLDLRAVKIWIDYVNPLSSRFCRGLLGWKNVDSWKVIRGNDKACKV